MHDFDLIIHKFPEGRDITLYCISDVHLGAEECMEQEFMAFIDRIAKEPDSYLLLGGDLIDNGTRNGVTNIFRATIPPSAQKREMAKILAPVAHKILAAVSGNHERRSGKDADDDPVYDILCKIDREDVYRENTAFIKFAMGTPEMAGQQRPCYVFAMTHGAGGGMLTSGAVLRGERYGYALSGIDGLIFGHTHKNFATVSGKINVDKTNNKVTVQPFYVFNMTSWLEYTAYAAQKMLLPSVHNLATITLCGDHKEIIVKM